MNILLAAFCIILFSLTVPFTRIATFEAAPVSIILIRLLGASLLCLLFALKDGWIPPKRALKGIFLTAVGSVIGFSSLTAFAMKEVPAGHGAVALASMPIVTAIYAVLRDRNVPGIKFWSWAVGGTLLSFSFFLFMNVNEILAGDLLLILSVFSAAFGYVEGGRMSREFGGRRVMTWAVLLTLPFTIPFALWYFKTNDPNVMNWSSTVWFSVGYLALVSQSSGMFLWFQVLAKGPMEKIAMVQLLQPFFTLLASIVLLNESVLWSTWIVAALVAFCVFGVNKEKSNNPVKISSKMAA